MNNNKQTDSVDQLAIAALNRIDELAAENARLLAENKELIDMWWEARAALIEIAETEWAIGPQVFVQIARRALEGGK